MAFAFTIWGTSTSDRIFRAASTVTVVLWARKAAVFGRLWASGQLRIAWALASDLGVSSMKAAPSVQFGAAPLRGAAPRSVTRRSAARDRTAQRTRQPGHSEPS